MLQNEGMHEGHDPARDRSQRSVFLTVFSVTPAATAITQFENPSAWNWRTCGAIS